MNCPKCGSSVGKSDEYCGSCGYHLVHDGGMTGGQDPHKKKKKSGLLIFAVILELAAIVAVACVIFLGFSDKKDSSSDETEVSSSENEDQVSEAEPESKETEVDSADETETAEPAPGLAEETQTAEPAPDTVNGIETAEAAPESAVPQESELSEAYLISDNTDTLDEIKTTYTRITEKQVTNSYASTTIEQDLVVNKPIFVFDNNDTTNWQEGASGPGIGEYIDFNFDKAYPVEYMTFKLGNWKTEEYYNGNYRPKTLQINSGNNQWSITFADAKQEFLVQLNPEVNMNNIRITIQDVYKDHIQWEDTPITEIGLWYK